MYKRRLYLFIDKTSSLNTILCVAFQTVQKMHKGPAFQILHLSFARKDSSPTQEGISYSSEHDLRDTNNEKSRSTGPLSLYSEGEGDPLSLHSLDRGDNGWQGPTFFSYVGHKLGSFPKKPPKQRKTPLVEHNSSKYTSKENR